MYSLLILIPPIEAASQAEDTALFPSAGPAADPLRSRRRYNDEPPSVDDVHHGDVRFQESKGVGHSVTATLGRDVAGILPRNREVLVYM